MMTEVRRELVALLGWRSWGGAYIRADFPGYACFALN